MLKLKLGNFFYLLWPNDVVPGSTFRLVNTSSRAYLLTWNALEIVKSPLCSCGKGKDLGIFGTKPEWNLKEFYLEATRIALSPLFSSSFPELPGMELEADMGNADIGYSTSLKSPVSEVSQSLTQCANCSHWAWTAINFCNQTKYCSRTCRKKHWKTHKLHCSSKASS